MDYSLIMKNKLDSPLVSVILSAYNSEKYLAGFNCSNARVLTYGYNISRVKITLEALF
jgi:hypothetical protein